jgi:hypothetical protein
MLYYLEPWRLTLYQKEVTLEQWRLSFEHRRHRAVEAHPSTLEVQHGAHHGAVRGPPVVIKSDKENFHVILKGQCHEIFDFWFFS